MSQAYNYAMQAVDAAFCDFWDKRPNLDPENIEILIPAHYYDELTNYFGAPGHIIKLVTIAAPWGVKVRRYEGSAFVAQEVASPISSSPQARPDFCENSPIRDSVKITCPVVESMKERKASQVPPIDQQWAEMVKTINKDTVKTIEKRLNEALAEGDLLIRLNARREQALEDSDANLAALLYDCMSVLKRATCKIPDYAYQCEGCICGGDE